MPAEIFDGWVHFWSVQSLWWTFGIFFASALTEMWFPLFPGDAFYFVGIVSVAASNVSIVAVIVATCLGGLAGFTSLYWLGQFKGRELFNRRTSGLWSAQTLAKLERWFARWGGWVIVFGRFLSGVRSAVPLAAGIGSFPRAQAITYGAISILIWNGLLAVAALILGEHWDRISRIFGTYNLAFWGIAILIILAWAGRLLWRRR